MAQPNGNGKLVVKNVYSSPPKETAPPAYEASPSDLTTTFSELNLASETSDPTTDRCIAHLKLLEAFHQLREDIATTDGLFGIKDCWVPTDLSRQEQAAVLLKIREKRWAIFVAKAASRFEAWWKKSILPSSKMLQQFDIRCGTWKREDAERGEEVLPFVPDILPPLGKFA